MSKIRCHGKSRLGEAVERARQDADARMRPVYEAADASEARYLTVLGGAFLDWQGGVLSDSEKAAGVRKAER